MIWLLTALAIIAPDTDPRRIITPRQPIEKCIEQITIDIIELDRMSHAELDAQFAIMVRWRCLGMANQL